MVLFVTRWQCTVLLSTISYYPGRAEWRVVWQGLQGPPGHTGPPHAWVRAERERLLRRVG